MNWVLGFLLGYALGSIPFGLIVTRIGGAGDLRSIGSGNIGATNVLRTGRKGLAATTLLFDLLKGLAAVLLAEWLLPGSGAAAGFGAFLGHCFSLWMGFRGGKGVATTAGVAFGLAWPVGVLYAFVWLVLLGTTRVSSVAGMTAAVVAPIGALVFNRPDAAGVLALIAIIVLFQHRQNIARLRGGTEPRIGGTKA
ncbi:glycerol-3-phosphate 1-O-acyltransferase PlsY [Novosphingobium aquimarinum]|uniref:glycerol-3-phosphate 1-O-acyltransferase PlsY n=1 Tax=Novosphingobium aquimarinum TaxID=2682494 RepID=UPI0012EC611A|nr:glycerol-3-phosphate 1-O-acyltransferase PlsY [Novosphingobium aquimarinum]